MYGTVPLSSNYAGQLGLKSNYPVGLFWYLDNWIVSVLLETLQCGR